MESVKFNELCSLCHQIYLLENEGYLLDNLKDPYKDDDNLKKNYESLITTAIDVLDEIIVLERRRK